MVRQFTTLIRMTRRPCQIEPLKKAVPSALIAAMTAWVWASWSRSEAPGRGSRNRTKASFKATFAIGIRSVMGSMAPMLLVDRIKHDNNGTIDHLARSAQGL